MPTKSPLFLELAHLVISLLCGDKPVLVAVNWFTSPHYWWVLWVIAGWGISLLITAIEKSIKY